MDGPIDHPIKHTIAFKMFNKDWLYFNPYENININTLYFKDTYLTKLTLSNSTTNEYMEGA